ncbi:Metallo-dependent phosphatase-like protein [Podospora appendiculata]|uniref:Double-strand break repair protein n=1 Tax=Podospora appendiculata TaxID=314037 RepID=A0AAE1C9H5_9PEZI|nr:Metallo-dependent phosphatase-like protein [Podospora appendiculata]
MPQATEEDVIRILVATDNHVGYEERDPVRKDDSWRTFDEIMQLARKQDVDMVLLGGDLFHDNKPSRKSMYQVMRSLRKNCLGMKPCELEFLSDAADVFEGAFTHVNYQDPDINISIPVFSIHGNHDDPSGDGHYCSLDLLQVAGLVNYFGRVPEADNIHVKPILLQKGQTKLALYGLSNVRDERMHRTFRDNKVRFYRPNQQASDFFNLLTVHQNHYAHTPTSYLPENMLPDFMDLVVWGHEHECLIDPTRNMETGFHVMQPGSSVATSLIPGEAVTKHVAILSITGKNFEVEKIPLKTVRPFVTGEVVLATDKRFKGLATKPDNRQEITKRLITIVDEMIAEANATWRSTHEEDEMDDDEEQPLPLIRLRVEYTAPEGSKFEVENPQRFSNRFAGKVANTSDVVYFYRKKTVSTRKVDVVMGLPEGNSEALDGVADTVKVSTLVNDMLAQQSLKILPQVQFADAVNQFVVKDDHKAVDLFVADSLGQQFKSLLQLEDEKVAEGLDSHMEDFRKVMDKEFLSGHRRQGHRRTRFKDKPDDWDSDVQGHWEAQEEALEEVQADDDDVDSLFMDAQAAPKPKPKRKATTATTRKVALGKKAAAPKKAPARGRKKANPFMDESEEEDEEEEEMDEILDDDDDVVMEDDDDEEEDEVPPPKKAPARKAPAKKAQAKKAAPKKAAPAKATRATRGAAAGKQTTLNFSQSQRPAPKTRQKEASPDEISDDDDAFESMPTRSRRR